MSKINKSLLLLMTAVFIFSPILAAAQAEEPVIAEPQDAFAALDGEVFVPAEDFEMEVPAEEVTVSEFLPLEQSPPVVQEYDEVSITRASSPEDYYFQCSRLIAEHTDFRAAAADGDFAMKRLIIKTDGTLLDYSLISEFSPAEIIEGPENYVILQFYSEENTEDCYNALQGGPGIIYIEADGVAQASDMVFEDDEPAIDKQNSFMSWGATAIGADKYAQYIKDFGKNRSVKVAVVDSGIFLHSDLSGRLTGDGYNFAYNNYNTSDDNYHGTHVAGTIADCTPSLSVYLMPIKVLDSSGSGSNLNVANGIRYAADRGASVINLSLGSNTHEQYLDDAVNYAINNKNCVVVMAAGNNNRNTSYECPMHMTNSIVVSSVNSYYYIASDSNFGGSVDVAAPGVSITSCGVGGGYRTASGTSMAAPHVSAAAAMLRMVYPSYTPAQIENLVRKHTLDLGYSGYDIYYGYGMVKIDKAVPKAIRLNKSTASVYTGKKYRLVPTVSPSNDSVSWYSSNKSVATVDQTGVVSGLKAGTVTITAKTSSGKKASCKVSVKQSGVKLNSTYVRLAPGKKYRLVATTTPSARTVSWKSSNTSIATVTSNGVVTAKKPGAVTITCTIKGDSTAKKTCRISIPSVKVTSVSLNRTSATLTAGDALTLRPTIYPDNASSKTVTWTSSNSSVASVNSKGVVTANAPGSATITVTTKSQGKTASCRIAVTS